MRTLLYKSYVGLYRVAAMLVLYGMLLGIGAYAFVMGFYAVSTSWVVPLLISPSNDKILTMTAQLVSSQQAMDNLTLTNKGLEAGRIEMIARRTALLSLAQRLDSALSREKTENAASGVELAKLAEQKRSDIAQTQTVLNNVSQMKADIERDLKAGLITRSEALAQQTALTQLNNTYTDNRIGEVMLRDSVRQKETTDLTAVDMLTKQVELKSEIEQLNLQVNTGDDQIRNNAEQIGKIVAAIKTTRENPYYLATSAQSALEFAFVPYDNQSKAVAGAPVYDCYLNMLFCRKVGTVERVFSDEQHTIHPIYKTDLRGFLVQLNMTNHESAKSKTLFLNRKPLLF